MTQIECLVCRCVRFAFLTNSHADCAVELSMLLSNQNLQLVVTKPKKFFMKKNFTWLSQRFLLVFSQLFLLLLILVNYHQHVIIIFVANFYPPK